MSNVPGINAKHAVITPTCRANRTDEGAFDEAIERLRAEYGELLKLRGGDGAKYHLVLAVEPPPDAVPTPGGPCTHTPLCTHITENPPATRATLNSCTAATAEEVPS